MSMKYYPSEAYGLLAFPDDLQGWWDRETEGFGTDAFEQELVNFSDVNEALPHGEALVVYDCDGDVYSVDDKGTCEMADIDVYKQDFVFLALANQPMLFSTAYPSRTAAIESLKELYSEILPSDFDYDKRFVCYEGVELA